MNTTKYILEEMQALVEIPSPSGFTKEIMDFIIEEVKSLGFSYELLNKGGVIVTIPGEDKEVVGLTSHIDTLGAMVRSITTEGFLTIVPVGGMVMESIEGSYCKIHTRFGKTYTGTILSKSPSVHSYDDARTLERTERNMLVRIDEMVSSLEDVKDLGIENGDYISFEPHFESLDNGFIKSRHLDDKASASILLGLLYDISTNHLTPSNSIKIIFSTYEEVGYGASYIPDDIKTLLAIDMGAIGDDLAGSEYKVSICAKDSSGPYDYELTTQLITLAKNESIDYVVDIFPHYGSDVSTALRGGNNIRGGLIGPGIHASHGMERTHIKAIQNTFSLLKAFLNLN